MNRRLIAGLLAVAVLPATALAARAADPSLTHTYSLDCSIASDGGFLAFRMMVNNTSGHFVPKGTPIRLYVQKRDGELSFTAKTVRDASANRPVLNLKPPKGAATCRATVTLAMLSQKEKVEQRARMKQLPPIKLPR